MIDLSREGDVFVLRMQHEENRFDADFIDGWNDALDRVEKADAPKALVTTGSGKLAHAASGDIVIGRALETAGAEDELISTLLFPPFRLGHVN